MERQDLISLKKLSKLSNHERYLRDQYLKKFGTGEIQGPMTGYPSIDMPHLRFYDDAFNEDEIPHKSIYPATIAQQINTLPFVKNCAVIGFEHPKEQAVPVVFFELKKDCNLSNDEAVNLIRDFCYENMEETSVAYDYVQVDVIPINVGGKIDVLKLKSESKIDYMKDVKL